jgi:hypothetical protein
MFLISSKESNPSMKMMSWDILPIYTNDEAQEEEDKMALT